MNHAVKERQKCTEFVWVQRDGTPIHVRNMTDQHLLCTIRLLRQWGRRMADKYNSDNHPWDAEDAKGMYWYADHEFTESHPTWKALRFERRMRGLEELPNV